ncbi:MAG: BNR-4 repeat-containing protein [Alphaproteobacteria bacterium]|nr:BNR-4 repeat-containing protein [Alphaproteobacteria bacterium]
MSVPVKNLEREFAEYVRLFREMPDKIRAYRRAQKWKMRRKIAVYTAVIDNYDTLKLPHILSPEIDYICFCNRPINNVGVWQIRACPWLDSDGVKTARYIKTHPHYLLEDYDVAVWIDANLLPCCDLMMYVKRFLRSDKLIGAVPHPVRSDIYQELEACIECGKDDEQIMRLQIEKYRAEGFMHNDLIESNFMIFRSGEPKLEAFLNMWWSEIEQHSRRDQLSLNYCLQKCGIEWYPLFPKGVCCRNISDILLLPHDKNEGKYKGLLDLLPSEVADPYSNGKYANVRKKRLKAVKNKEIDVVVCIHNAQEYVRQCVESLLKWHRSDKEHIILIDDGSDAPTAEYLRQMSEKHKCLRLIRHDKAVGYTKSANEGFRCGRGDLVILLNSDTIVTKNWSRKMADAVFSNKGAGVVGPMSSAATAQSLPSIVGKDGQTAINNLPEGITPQMMNELCENTADSEVVLRVPTVHGFCFGVTRKCLDVLKGFDEEHFPTGFGEEDDFCMRTGKAGFSMVIATHTFVYHAKTKSFDAERRKQLCQAGAENLWALHGKKMIEHAGACVRRNMVLQAMRNTVQTLFDAYDFKYKKGCVVAPRQRIKFNPEKVVSSPKIGEGFAANAVNTLPFRKNALTTYFSKWGKSVQFAAWYDAYGRIVVAKKVRNKWQNNPTQFYNEVQDAHNVVSIAVDGSGYVHLVWCRHKGTLCYARSVKPLSTEFKENIIIGTQENKATYPEFYVQPSGDLLLMYRDGCSGCGKLVLNHYRHKIQRWQRLSDCLIDGEGKESPYWQACVDYKGCLHISWCWRENNNVTSNHDICYMRSTDESCTQFVNIEAQRMILPQTPDNAAPIYAIPQGSGLINQTSMTVDEKNNPYIATFWQYNGVLQYMLLFAENGRWKAADTGIRRSGEIIDGRGTKKLPCARPQILVRRQRGKCKIMLLLRDDEYGGKLLLARVKIKNSAVSHGYDLLTNTALGVYEPMYDILLWQKRRKLSVFVQYASYKEDEEVCRDILSEDIRIICVNV